MRLFIPACGDRIVLTADWSFNLYLEHRNTKFADTRELLSAYKLLADKADKDLLFWGIYNKDHTPAIVRPTLPAGTILECDRVYIRATSKSFESATDSFDSISWKVIIGGKPARNQRFWAKLTDCYNIEYEVSSIYRDREKAR